MSEFNHISVLSNEVIDALNIKNDGVYVDCTLGGAGHGAKIVEKLSEKGKFIGIDRDIEAIEAAKIRLTKKKPQIDIIQSNFKNIENILNNLGIEKVDGVLFDLGVSSHQIDTKERGFSYITNGVLDMRMDRSQSLSAYEVVNTYDEEDLTKIFLEYGEERWGKRVAKFICDFRKKSPIKTTGELVNIIDRAIPKEARRSMEGHSAKRIFQAIRIEVNDELNILENAFKTATNFLNPGGRLAVITFHSLEDRIAKSVFKELSTDCLCPKNLPICVCNHKKSVRIIGKPKRASIAELKDNRRAKSATLRVVEKI